MFVFVPLARTQSEDARRRALATRFRLVRSVGINRTDDESTQLGETGDPHRFIRLNMKPGMFLMIIIASDQNAGT